MLLFLVAPERPWPAIIIHFAAEMNIVVHETCNLISALQKSLAPVVADAFLVAKMLRTVAVQWPMVCLPSRAGALPWCCARPRGTKKAPVGLALVEFFR
jgi:hypothetical protein